MSQVFFELEFVTIKDGLIAINPEKTKKDLGDSPAYQQKQNQHSIGKRIALFIVSRIKAMV